MISGCVAHFNCINTDEQIQENAEQKNPEVKVGQAKILNNEGRCKMFRVYQNAE